MPCQKVETFMKGNVEKFKGFKQEDYIVRYSFYKDGSLDLEFNGVDTWKAA